MAENGEQAVAVYQRLKPDVVLMDLVMPHVDGATATARIRAEDPNARVIILTSFVEDRLVRTRSLPAPPAICSRAPVPTNWRPPFVLPMADDPQLTPKQPRPLSGQVPSPNLPAMTLPAESAMCFPSWSMVGPIRKLHRRYISAHLRCAIT